MKQSKPCTPSHNANDVTALLLAGGRGERMNGQDKGFVKYKNTTLIETAINTLKPQVKQIIISCNRNIESYARFGFPTTCDQSSTLGCDDYSGPIAGILSAAQLAKSPYIQLCPCDTPQLSDSLVHPLMQALALPENLNSVIAVPFDGTRIQPLHSLVHMQSIPSLRAYFTNGGRKIRDWIAQQAFIEVDFSNQSSQFRNINRPEDLTL